jgi:hypothetical protein
MRAPFDSSVDDVTRDRIDATLATPVVEPAQAKAITTPIDALQRWAIRPAPTTRRRRRGEYDA